MRLTSSFAALMAVITLAGCASSRPFSGGRTWEDGWRKGVVSSINDELRWYQRPACGKRAGPGDKYVSVSYRASGQTRWKYIPMPAKQAPEPQSKVLLNVNSCELARDA
ncbi:MAG: hypothetical protein J0L58_01665 [Burkholderiales bacterium]|jgi:hypothetical protein|uniref:Lipoprotein n=1 Tax=Inhella inkyongensis TaxID=392593 RepID=A0A840SA74_9BURK|nr:hypothetical protein [Inhella inkyongensis]MBB5205401.1 hypothetical protein [Inhella inkyongensis]MBN8503157.1 hypothetical protein [Burkholderiales bacterium]